MPTTGVKIAKTVNSPLLNNTVGC